jgi:hypothetical protein
MQAEYNTFEYEHFTFTAIQSIVMIIALLRSATCEYISDYEP